ncbi:hypothetical protein GN958_ATG17734, partial [Phytophthora infestans]
NSYGLRFKQVSESRDLRSAHQPASQPTQRSRPQQCQQPGSLEDPLFYYSQKTAPSSCRCMTRLSVPTGDGYSFCEVGGQQKQAVCDVSKSERYHKEVDRRRRRWIETRNVDPSDQPTASSATGYSDDSIVIRTPQRSVETKRDSLCETVYPVVAMELCILHDTLTDRLLKPSACNVPCQPVTAACLTKDILPNVSSAFDRVFQRIDPHSGHLTCVSLQHVISYVFNIDGCRALPPNLEGVFGSTFSEMGSGQST